MAHCVTAVPLVRLRFTFSLENQYRPSGQGRNPTKGNVFKGAHVDGVNLWSGNVEWLQIVNRYPLMPPSSSNMRGTLQSLCLASPFLGCWRCVKVKDGSLVGEILQIPDEPKRSGLISLLDLDWIHEISWHVWKYWFLAVLDELYPLSSSAVPLLSHRNGSPRVAGPSPSDHWVTDGDARWTRPSHSHRGAV